MPGLEDRIDEVVAVLRARPEPGRVTPTAVADLAVDYRVTVGTGDHELVVDEPESLGGSAAGPTPVEVALVALASCQAITYRIWAGRLGIDVDAVHVRVECDYDVRGLLGVDGPGRPGFTEVRLVVDLDGSTAERHEELRAAVDAHCPVLDVLTTGVPVHTTLASATG